MILHIPSVGIKETLCTKERAINQILWGGLTVKHKANVKPLFT